MSDTLIEQLRLRHQELQYDAVAIRGRIEELAELIILLEKRRGGRPKAFHTRGVTVVGGSDNPSRAQGGLGLPDITPEPPEAAE